MDTAAMSHNHALPSGQPVAQANQPTLPALCSPPLTAQPKPSHGCGSLQALRQKHHGWSTRTMLTASMEVSVHHS